MRPVSVADKRADEKEEKLLVETQTALEDSNRGLEDVQQQIDSISKAENHLRACGDCGSMISRRADKCPHCGAPMKAHFKPSGGVIAIGILSIIFGIIGLLLIPLGFVFITLGNVLLGSKYSTPSSSFALLRLPIDIVLDTILIISGIWILMLKNWARMLGIVYGWAQIILFFLAFIIGISEFTEALQSGNQAVSLVAIGGLVGGLVGMIPPIVLLIFYSRDRVREQFKAQSFDQH